MRASGRGFKLEDMKRVSGYQLQACPERRPHRMRVSQSRNAGRELRDANAVP
jgi:hypothetical protein